MAQAIIDIRTLRDAYLAYRLSTGNIEYLDKTAQEMYYAYFFAAVDAAAKSGVPLEEILSAVDTQYAA